MCSGFFWQNLFCRNMDQNLLRLKFVCDILSVLQKKIDLTKISGILKFADSERAEIQTTWLTKSLSISVCFNSVEWHQRIIINIGRNLSTNFESLSLKRFCEVCVQTRKTNLCGLVDKIYLSKYFVVWHFANIFIGS